jgi:hypothetical protein
MIQGLMIANPLEYMDNGESEAWLPDKRYNECHEVVLC